ncbi:coat protein [Trichoderma harzianum mycovirus 1]|uniref:Coat protein n=1 Tax=Trichoderma harzianum mycovirus 1 TaxID=2487095 RepID=A0A4P2UPF3_9VIRU|nr:coat protein [Trichoderma harzianum mycovirus 1]
MSSSSSAPAAGTAPAHRGRGRGTNRQQGGRLPPLVIGDSGVAAVAAQRASEGTGKPFPVPRMDPLEEEEEDFPPLPETQSRRKPVAPLSSPEDIRFGDAPPAAAPSRKGKGVPAKNPPGQPVPKIPSDPMPTPRPRWDVLVAVRTWHELNQVDPPVTAMGELFPERWRLGRTEIAYGSDVNKDAWLGRMLPALHFWTAEGTETPVLTGAGKGKTVRVTATHHSAVDLVRFLLSWSRRTEVDRDAVIDLAQKSPAAMEALKDCVKQFRAHFGRLLDMVALRRHPDFNAVAAQYKAQVRALVDQQYQAVLALRAATRALNDCLVERDQALAGLDPGYTPKKVSAKDVLAQYGLDLGDEEVVAAEEAAGSEELYRQFEEDFM